jgi:hypothetical protein
VKNNEAVELFRSTGDLYEILDKRKRISVKLNLLRGALTKAANQNIRYENRARGCTPLSK